MADFALNLTADAARALRQALTDFHADADLRYAAVIEESGVVLCEHGDPAHHDHGETAAIATGAFFAAQTLARRLGESEFSGLHYEGSQRHFFLAPLTAQTILLCVFANETRIAIVRACARRAIIALSAALRRMTDAPPEIGDFSVSRIETAPFSESSRRF
jgi:predicted regulator of Ras-like GTPase activity (Roadblock/LC7/MglB family)